MTENFQSLRMSTPIISINHINGGSIDVVHDKTERLNCYEIIWIKSGSGLLELNLKTHPLQTRTVCCFAPGQVRRIKFNDSTVAIRFRLLPDYFYRLCVEVRFPILHVDTNQPSNTSLIRIAETAEPEFNNIIQKLETEFASDVDADDMQTVWLKLFLMYLKRQADFSTTRTTPNRDVDLVTKFLGLVAKNFTIKKMVAEYASDLSVSPNYLNMVVKRVSGFPASFHIQQFIILEAKREALASVRSMKEIAYALGFADIAHFSKYFKSKSGTNFTDFKKMAG